MSELNKAAQDYLDSLGIEVPHVEDAAPKIFDTQDRRNKVVPQPPPKIRPYSRKVTMTRALGAPYNLKSSGPSYEEPHPDFKMGLWHYVEEKMKTPAEKWDAINFQPLPIAAEEVVAPRAWRTLPTGNEVRAAILIGVLILSVIAFFVMRTP